MNKEFVELTRDMMRSSGIRIPIHLFASICIATRHEQSLQPTNTPATVELINSSYLYAISKGD